MSNQSTKRRKAVIAAVAAAALFMGGSTYALWSANARIQGGEVTAGELSVQAGPLSVWDVSLDRTDHNQADQNGRIITPALVGTDGKTLIKPVTLNGTSYMEWPPEYGPNPYGPNTSLPYGHLIDRMDTWRMIPGDMVAVAVPAKITLVGDNLVASLAFYLEGREDPDTGYYLDFCTDLIKSDIHPMVEYQMFNEDGEALAGREVLCSDGHRVGWPTPLLFQARNEGQDDGTWEGGIGPDDAEPMPIATVGEDGTATVVFMVYLNFWEGIGRSDTQYTETMLYDFAEGISVYLQQVRCGLNDSNWKDWEGNPLYPNNFTECPNSGG